MQTFCKCYSMVIIILSITVLNASAQQYYDLYCNPVTSASQGVFYVTDNDSTSFKVYDTRKEGSGLWMLIRIVPDRESHTVDLQKLEWAKQHPFDKLQGTFTYTIYGDNEIMESLTLFHNDVPIDSSFTYHPNGEIEGRRYYVNGKTNGLGYNYYPDGNIHLIYSYGRDSLYDTLRRYENNGIIWEIAINDGARSERRMYDKKGILSEIEIRTYKSSSRDGRPLREESRKYYRNGKSKSIERRVSIGGLMVRDGICEYYDQNGNKRIEEYVEGETVESVKQKKSEMADWKLAVSEGYKYFLGRWDGSTDMESALAYGVVIEINPNRSWSRTSYKYEYGKLVDKVRRENGSAYGTIARHEFLSGKNGKGVAFYDDNGQMLIMLLYDGYNRWIASASFGVGQKIQVKRR